VDYVAECITEAVESLREISPLGKC